MVFVFYLKFVRLRDQLTVETRRNLDPCQIDNFVSGLILSLLTDCRLCPAPGPPSASAAIPALREINITNKPTHRELSRFKEIKIIHQTHNYNSCKSFSCQSLCEDCRPQVSPAPLIETGPGSPQVDHSHVNFHSFLHPSKSGRVRCRPPLGRPPGIHCKYCK